MKYRGNFDDITYFLESFYEKEKDRLKSNRKIILDDVFKLFDPFKGEKISKKDSMKLILSCTNYVLLQLEDTCKKQSIDIWLTIIRRFHSSLFNFSSWRHYATLAVIKWSNYDENSTCAQVNQENQFNIIFAITEDILHDCWKICTLSEILDKMTSYSRWVSKGAKLIIEEDGSLRLEKSDDVRTAVEYYEKRRPSLYFLQDEGTPILTPFGSHMNSILLLFNIEETIELKIQKNNKSYPLQI